MEDGFPLFDPNDEAARQEQRLREYYEEFSANARKRLLSKTLVRPSSVYDVLYPQTRETLLSKNKPFETDLEEDAKLIRDRLIAKLVTNETDLEKVSADFRKSMLARAKIQDDRQRLLREGEAFRKSLISKNAPKSTDLEQDSRQARNANVAKNKPNPSIQDSIDKNSGIYRDGALAKNTPKEQDLLQDSEAFRNQYRKNDLHKNVPNKSDLEKDSEAYRNKNLSKNTDRPTTIDENSKLIRESELAKNASKETDLEADSKAFRKTGLAKNTPKDQDLLRDSENVRNQYKENDLNKNVPSKTDIERDSALYRRNNLHKNPPKNSDIESDSEIYRNSNLGKNKEGSGAGLEEIGEEKRKDELSKNKGEITNLENDSAQFREDDLAKNTPKATDLERDSEIYRSNDLSANKPKNSDLEKDSAPYRSDDLSANKPNPSNLEEDSVIYRDDDLSLNVPKETDLERDSAQTRADDLALNVPSFSDLETDSVPFRSDDLSLNTPNFTDLENDSIPFRSDDLSLNTPKNTDLETDSVVYRDDDLSLNVPSLSDLELDSEPYRLSDLSANIDINTDLETDSVPFRDDDLSFNVPSTSDLIVDSTPYLFNNLSANVPNGSDIETDSVTFRNDDLSANVPNTSDLLVDSEDFRDDDLAANVPNTSDLLADSNIHRLTDLAANVPNNSNLAQDSIQYREDDLASNVPLESNLLTDSTQYRDAAIANNAGFGLLGVNVNGAGTSAFLGISRVFTQGILVRQLLLSKNVPKETNLLEGSKEIRENNLFPNDWVPQAAGVGSSLEYGTSNTHFTLLDATRKNTGAQAFYANFDANGGSPIKKAIEAQAYYTNVRAFDLQQMYGSFERTATEPFREDDFTFSDKAFSVDTTSPQGGRFDAPTNTATAGYFYNQGYVTENIRLYQLARNSYNTQSIQPGSLDGFNNLSSFVGDEAFQDLVAKTIGSLDVRGSVSTQLGTNTTPVGVILANDGKYYPGNGDLLKPAAENAPLGTAESMMAKTAIGNPYEDEDFFLGRRGVKRIVNTIKESDNPMASNFDPQNSNEYIIGTNRDGSARISRQRFTIANPYAPQGAGRLVFLIKNYASEEEYSFPPYIDSFQNTENANWNSTNFLGRPEAIYTYNNSSRDASISFYVLTDYAQRVDIGRDWNSEGMEKVSTSIGGHFTQKDFDQNKARRDRLEALKAKQAEDRERAQELSEKIEENNNAITNVQEKINDIEGTDEEKEENSNWFSDIVKDKKEKEVGFFDGIALGGLKSEGGILNKRKQDLEAEAAKTNKEFGDVTKEIGGIDNEFNKQPNYSESNNTAGNVYNINVIKKEFVNGETICKPEDTIVRIDTMKKNLMFQPAYFSGDKVDFVRKIEFLSKLTRPAANDTATGFAFTTPPICHIHLGDWWNHDIVVNSVSFDYTDAPWTLEGGRVQPMWVLVSINFNMIGPYKSFSGRPPLATDPGGMYSPVNGITSA